MGPLDDTVRKVLTSGFVTRFSVSPKVARKFLPEVVEQWGKLRHLEGGDIMHKHDVVSKHVDNRHASFVCVREFFFLENTQFLSFAQ